MTLSTLSRRFSFLFAASLAFAGCDGESDPPSDDGGATEGGGQDGGEGDDQGEGGGDDNDGDDDADAGGEESGAAAGGFASDVAPILAASCGCHTGATPSAGLDLGAGAAYDALVGVASSAGVPYVTAGDAAASYLVNKLDGSQAEVGGGGGQMPQGGMLPADEIDTIVAWIDAGAMP